MQALYEAADEDAATGGPDLMRGIFPVVATVDERGFTLVDEGGRRAVRGGAVAARSPREPLRG